jgi:hypothetical protein
MELAIKKFPYSFGEGDKIATLPTFVPKVTKLVYNIGTPHVYLDLSLSESVPDVNLNSVCHQQQKP